MKVAKCCESKEPELLTFEQIKEREGVYAIEGSDSYGLFRARVLVVQGVAPLYLAHSGYVEKARFGDDRKFIRTDEIVHFGFVGRLKDAAGKWVE